MLSPKSCIVASLMSVAKAISRLTRRRYGVALPRAESARDLGADAAGGRRRRGPIARDGAATATVRMARVGRRAERTAAASRLILTGAFPQLEYAVEMQGVGRRRIR